MTFSIIRNIALLILVLISYSSNSFSQLAVVRDEGGFANIYDKEKQDLDRLGSDAVVAIIEDDGVWALIDYTKYEGYAASSGYIKKDNLVEFSAFEEFQITESSDNKVVFSKNDISISLSSSEFVKENNDITYFSDENRDIITAINKKPYWGTKIGLPISKYESIVVEKEDETINFPEEALFNLFNPHLSLTKVFFDLESDTVYICSQNGDASGAYTAVWIVEFDEYSIHYIFD